MEDRLRECPRGLLKTIAYTQLCEAIEKDFGIELPRKTGKEIPKVIDELINIRATDPLLEKMVAALEELVAKVSHGMGEYDTRIKMVLKAKQILQEYREMKDADKMHTNK